jgi:Terminase small subunit
VFQNRQQKAVINFEQVNMTKSPTALRRAAFCRNYIASLKAGSPNAAMAARAAGFSPNGSKQAGARLLRHPDIQARLKGLGAPLTRQAEIQNTTAVLKAQHTMGALLRGEGDPKTAPMQLRAAKAILELGFDPQIARIEEPAPPPEPELTAEALDAEITTLEAQFRRLVAEMPSTANLGDAPEEIQHRLRQLLPPPRVALPAESSSAPAPATPKRKRKPGLPPLDAPLSNIERVELVHVQNTSGYLSPAALNIWQRSGIPIPSHRVKPDDTAHRDHLPPGLRRNHDGTFSIVFSHDASAA